MSDVVWRSPESADLRAARDLAERCAAAAGTIEARCIDQLAARLESDSGIGDVSRVVYDDGRLIAVGWAHPMSAPDGSRSRLYVLAAPGDPAAFDVLQWLDQNCTSEFREARIERILRADARLPSAVTSGYARLGYDRYYTELEMVREIDNPQSVRESGTNIVPWGARRHDEVRRAYNDAFATRGFRGFGANEWERAFVVDVDFGESFSFLALDQDTVVGFVLSRVNDRAAAWTDPWLRDLGWIDSIGVRASYQGQAIGTQLMDASLSAMRHAGVKLAGLRVNDENRPAINLYRKLGFATARKHIVYRRLIRT